MNYIGMPMGMWGLFSASFEKNMISVLGFEAAEAKAIRAKAKPIYRGIIAKLPDFEKGDRFQMNIVNCAMFSAFYLCMEPKPGTEKMTVFYREAMMTGPMKWFCRQSAKSKFGKKDLSDMRKTEALRAADRNPYSWNMELYPYRDGSGYEARFTACGICTLLRELGIFELAPAMCALDYAMSEAGGRSDFVRRYTIASGGPYCDCGYHKKKV